MKRRKSALPPEVLNGLEGDNFVQLVIPALGLILLTRRVEPEGPGGVERVLEGEVGGGVENGLVASLGLVRCFGNSGVRGSSSGRRQGRVGRREGSRGIGGRGGHGR
jgi:hypothetical protein